MKYTLRDIDCLIAEKIEGIEIVHREWPCGYSPDCGNYEASSHEKAYRNEELGPVYTPYYKDGWPPKQSYLEHGDKEWYAHVHPIPFYSTDLNLAMKVIGEWAKKENLQIRIEIDNSGAEVCIYKDYEFYGVVEKISELSLALCTAALSYLDIDVEYTDIIFPDNNKKTLTEKEVIEEFMK